MIRSEFQSKYKTYLIFLIIITGIVLIVGIYFEHPVTYLILFLFALLVASLFLPKREVKAEWNNAPIVFVKNCVEIIAVLGVIFYLLGITDLSLEIETQRESANSEEDYVLINVKLTKGNIGSIYLHDIKAFAYIDDSVDYIKIVNFNGLKKIKPVKIGDDYFASNIEEGTDEYIIAANEATQFASSTKIPKGQVVRFEILVIAERWKLVKRTISQFRASTVSLPSKPNVPPKPKAHP